MYMRCVCVYVCVCVCVCTSLTLKQKLSLGWHFLKEMLKLSDAFSNLQFQLYLYKHLSSIGLNWVSNFLNVTAKAK